LRFFALVFTFINDSIVLKGRYGHYSIKRLNLKDSYGGFNASLWCLR